MNSVNNIKFGRNDGVIFKGSDFSNSVVKDYVHKQVVKKTGDGEDDFILEEKPILVRTHDIFKEIQVEAEKNNLKALIEQYLRSGDETIFHQTDKSSVDLTNIPEDVIEMKKLSDKAQAILKSLPKDLQGKDIEDILKMSQEEILKAYGIVLPKKEEPVPPKKEEPVPPMKEGE